MAGQPRIHYQGEHMFWLIRSWSRRELARKVPLLQRTRISV